MNLLLDSTFLIDMLRGEPSALARLAVIFEDGDQPILNEIVVCEVRAGLIERDVAAFEDRIRWMEFVQPGPAAPLRAGQWRADSRARGRVLSLADALIAAAADANDAAVLTRNVRDFSLTPVRVETY